MHSNSLRKFISTPTNANQCSDSMVSWRWLLMVASSSGRTLPTLAKDSHRRETPIATPRGQCIAAHIKGGTYATIWDFPGVSLDSVCALTTSGARWSCAQEGQLSGWLPRIPTTRNQLRMGRSIDDYPLHLRLSSPLEMGTVALVEGIRERLPDCTGTRSDLLGISSSTASKLQQGQCSHAVIDYTIR